jgi:hypothetical protein
MDILHIDYENKTVKQYHPPKYKPIINYWKSSDPCLKLPLLAQKIVSQNAINVIRTKRISNDLIHLCLSNINTFFLHVYITGLSKTPFEKNIPSVKETFYQIKKLIDGGFPQKQILVVVDPLIPNDNGLNVLKLLLRVFTEFKELRLRFIRIRMMSYRQLESNGKYVPNNENLIRRQGIEEISRYLYKESSFIKDYYKLLDQYKSIISVDTDEALIGIRELSAFGYRNEWITPNGDKHKIIEYEGGNKYKPIVKIISGKAVRCSNRCLICPYYG